jgi:DNA repair protein RadD
VIYPQTRVLVATHVKELVKQNHDELLTLWPSAPAGIYSAGLKRRDTHLPITFCGIASIAKRVSDFGFIHLLIVDEAHLISDKESTMYHRALEELRKTNPFLKVVGLTATPFRLGMGNLTDGKLFTGTCCDYCTMEKFNELLDHGYISPLIPKATTYEISAEGVQIHGGEYVQSQLQDAVDRESITRAALNEALRLGVGRRHWLCFCAGTAHADHARDILIELGIPSVSVHSKLPGGTAERDKNIELFKSGQVGCMCGVGVFTTGFNFKPIDFIIGLRPTMSTSLWVQMLGRGTRPSPETFKKNCLVLDFAANTRRLGPINDPVIPRKKGKKSGSWVPYKICPACNTYNHTRAAFCIECGFEFPQIFAASTTASTDEIIRKKKEPKPPKPPEEEPQIIEWDVSRVEYAKHHSKDTSKPPSLRVTYYCGIRVFNEWLCLEHPQGFAKKKGRDAWRLMANSANTEDQCYEPPNSVDEALTRVDNLQPPTRIRVLMKEKFPEVVGYEFDALNPLTHSAIEPGLYVADPNDDVPF